MGAGLYKGTKGTNKGGGVMEYTDKQYVLWGLSSLYNMEPSISDEQKRRVYFLYNKIISLEEGEPLEL
jgi:hypothetical protein